MSDLTDRLTVLLRGYDLNDPAFKTINDVRLALMNSAAELALRDAEIRRLRNLLLRVSQWDVMDIPNSDGPYWRAEISAVLTAAKEG